MPFSLYLGTICPNIYWRDAPEFQTVAFQLGIAHPAGSPFYALTAKLFTFLPFGSIAFKANLCSAFFGALLVLLLFLLIYECLAFVFPANKERLLLFCGGIGVSFYAVSQSLWQNAIVAEVYTLQNCFIVTIALCLIHGLRRPQRKFLYTAAFLFGLSSGSHIIMILYIPALALFLWLFYRKSLSISHIGVIFMFVILGASIYLYLPVRSSVNPYYDWGNPENVQNFTTHVTDRKDVKKHFSFSLHTVIPQLKTYGQYYVSDFSFSGIILGLTGLLIILRRKPKLFWGLFALFFSQWFFFIRYWPWSSAFIPTFLFFTIGIAIGLFYCIEQVQKLSPKGRRRYLLTNSIYILCAVNIFFLAGSNWRTNDRSDYWSPYEFFRYIDDQIEFRGVLVNSLYYFGTSYLQQCESYRPDITNLFLSEIFKPRVFNTVTAKRYPLIRIPQENGTKIGEAIINANIKNHPFYWDPTSKNSRVVQENLLPDGLLFRIMPSPTPLDPEIRNLHLKKMERFLSNYTPDFSRYSDQEENLLYSLVLESLSRFFYDLLDYKTTIGHLTIANQLTPDTTPILNGLASSHANLKDFPKAETYLLKALKIDPLNITTLQNLGQLYLETGKYSVALSYFHRVLKKDPKNSQVQLGIGVCYEKTKDIENARNAFQKVISMNPDSPIATEAKQRLSFIGY